jgi:hypothetical protein
MSAFTPAQLDLLRLFGNNLPESDLLEIKKLIVNYLASKTTNLADSAFDEKKYTPEDIESWKTENFRRSAK